MAFPDSGVTPRPLFQRCGHPAAQGTLFGLVGFSAGVIGTSLSNSLIALRKKMDPSYETQVRRRRCNEFWETGSRAGLSQTPAGREQPSALTAATCCGW